MTKKAEIAFGIIGMVGANVAATTATVTLGGVTGFALPEWSRDSVEITAHDSPGYTKEFIPGLNENGEVTWTLNWLPGNATDDVLEELKAEREGRLFTVEFPMNVVGGKVQVCSFRAFLTAKSPSVEDMAGQMTCSITLRPSTIPAWTEVDA